MIDLELPLKKRTRQYRFFEMLPAILSYGMLIMLVVLSLLSPLAAAIYLLLLIITVLVKAFGIAAHTITGRQRLDRAQKVDWHARLKQLEEPVESYEKEKIEHSSGFGFEAHKENLRLMAADSAAFPKPSQMYNAVIVAAYNEDYEVIEPTMQTLADTHYDSDRMIVIFTYEERGGEGIEKTAKRLEKRFKNTFKTFEIIKHPDGLPNEVRGKGGNITFAGEYLKGLLNEQKIAYKDVIVTTLDCDNRPHATYFDYVTYEYIVHEDRKHLSYQPIALFLNNIWDAPAPMRVLATGNSFWNIISSMRPHTLRNFASHSQPMDALVEMKFWSKRSIVEDGHQYWRSYFYFNGNYAVTPIYVPIYQDAVLSTTYGRTLKAQFMQLRRWAYGASDIPYVATRIFTKDRNVPLLPGLARLLRLIDGHVTLASISILVAVGGWVPLLINSQAARDIAAHQLPEVISGIQQVAMVGLLITVFLGFKMLPPRPARYKRHRTLWMVLQWGLMPVTAIVYSAASAFNAQTHLFLGKYLDNFDVTEKATHASVARARAKKADHVS
ncbi:MAG TPA: glycosyltransferase family 2 protein [Candidatus Chromulinivoraceae bacterium]|nr:glycosyltransferase family 2 protein [Candidatus Chromulinivoraceae bacterium]